MQRRFQVAARGNGATSFKNVAVFLRNVACFHEFLRLCVDLSHIFWGRVYSDSIFDYCERVCNRYKITKFSFFCLNTNKSVKISTTNIPKQRLTYNELSCRCLFSFPMCQCFGDRTHLTTYWWRDRNVCSS